MTTYPESSQPQPEAAAEQWRCIPHFPDYEVSNLGNIRRCEDGRPGVVFGHHDRSTGYTNYPAGTPIATHIGSHGYPETVLHRNGKPHRCTVHRLVCITWHGEPPSPGHEVGHLDGDRTNPRASNLHWVTRAENHRHAWQMGREPSGYVGRIGETNHAAKLTETDVRKIRTAHAAGTPQSALAEQHGVSAFAIWAAVNRRTWSHIP